MISKLIKNDNKNQIFGSNNQYWNSILLPWYPIDTLLRYWWYFGKNQDWLSTNVKGHWDHHQIGNWYQNKTNINSVIVMMKYD